MAKRPPAYGKHSSGQARVRIDGTIYYLGPYGAPESYEEYGRLLTEWRERQAAVRPQDMTVRALAVLFMRHARKHYRRDGRQTSEVAVFRCLLKRVLQTFGSCRVGDFGPLKLKRLRQSMIDDGWSRKSINKQTGRVRAVIAWGVAEELVPVEVLTALQTVKGLQAGRSDAVERDPIRPVAEADINATLQHVSPQVSAMIRLQLLTGCRPGEICGMRPADVDRSGDVWAYVPASHKTQHHGKSRTIFIGPRGQAILTPYLDRDADACCFVPAEAEAARRQKQREARKSPIQPSQKNRRKSEPKRKAGRCYSGDSYRRAIERGCIAAGVEVWSPNRLRHSRLTELRRSHGIETARVVAGHSDLKVTAIYAEVDQERARLAMAEVG